MKWAIYRLTLLPLLNMSGTDGAAIAESDIKPHLVDLYTISKNNQDYLENIFNSTRNLVWVADRWLHQGNSTQSVQQLIIDDVEFLKQKMGEAEASAVSHHIEVQQQMKSIEKVLSENKAEMQLMKESLAVLVQNSSPLSQNGLITFCVVVLTIMGIAMLGILFLYLYKTSVGSTESPIVVRIANSVMSMVTQRTTFTYPMLTDSPPAYSETSATSTASGIAV